MNSSPPAPDKKPKGYTKEKDARSTVGNLAKAAGVSHHKAAQAVKVTKVNPELAAKVAAGELKLKDAARLVEKPKPPKPEVSVKLDPLDECLQLIEQLNPKELRILLDALRSRLG